MSHPDSDETTRALGDTFRAAVSAATEAATAIAQRREQQLRQAAEESRAAEREYQRRMQGEWRADKMLLDQTRRSTWWDRATPERIRDLLERAGSWAIHGEPTARPYLMWLREELQDRYDVDLPEFVPHSRSLQDVLRGYDVAFGLVDGVRRQVREDEEPGDPPPAHSYKIFDTVTDEVVQTGTWALSEGRPVLLAAADTMDQYVASLRGEVEPERFILMPYRGGDPDNRDSVLSGLTEQARQRLWNWVDRLTSGRDEVPAERLGEVRQALLYKQTRLQDQIGAMLDPRAEARLRRVREQLAAYRAGAEQDGLSPDQWQRDFADRLAAAVGREQEQAAAADRDPDAWATRLGDLLADRAQTMLQQRMVEAQMRGEDPSHVQSAEILRGELDQMWLHSADSREVAAVWAEVQGWGEGQARTNTLAHLRSLLFRHYDIADLGPEADPQMVRERVDDAISQGERWREIAYEITDGEDRLVDRDRTVAPVAEPDESVARRLLDEFDVDGTGDDSIELTTPEREPVRYRRSGLEPAAQSATAGTGHSTDEISAPGDARAATPAPPGQWPSREPSTPPESGVRRLHPPAPAAAPPVAETPARPNREPQDRPRRIPDDRTPASARPASPAVIGLGSAWRRLQEARTARRSDRPNGRDANRRRRTAATVPAQDARRHRDAPAER